jgi:hypothetical protein
MRRACAWILALIVFAGTNCDRTANRPVAHGAGVRDSAGVEVVVNAPEQRQLVTREVLRIGVQEGDSDLQFSRVRALSLDDRGGIWVVDSHESVRHYDSLGVYRGSVGGVGQGPGEARGYGTVWSAGDHVLTWGYPSILQEFTTDGDLVAARQAISDGSTLMPLGHGGGRWFWTKKTHRPGAATVFRTTLHIVAAPSLSGPEDTVLTLPGELQRRESGDEYGRASYFFGDPSFAVDAMGRLFVSDTSQYHISMYDADGKLLRVVQRSVARRPYDPTWRAEVEEGVTAALRRDRNLPVDPGVRDRMVSSILPPDVPANLPVIDRLLVAPDGELWVERGDLHPRPGMRAVAHAHGYVRHAWRPEWKAAQSFDLFDARGIYRGSVAFPPDFAPMAATANRMYGISYDELGVEYIVAFEITAPRQKS